MEPPPNLADLLESFPALTALSPLVAHSFVRRVPGVDLSESREEVIARLSPWHHAAVEHLGFRPESLRTAKQVHGADIAILTADSPAHTLGVDGLITALPGLMLGIQVADCGPVYIVDPVKRVISLLHSGRKGSELGIAGRAARLMADHFDSRPQDLVVQLGPCIRRPRYEVDFPAMIVQSCLEAGVPSSQIHDCGTCTALDPDRYYSYRRDLGKTGRLLALLGLRASTGNP